jgi:hypothetical protein
MIGLALVQDQHFHELLNEATSLESHGRCGNNLAKVELAQQLCWCAHLRMVRLGHEMRGELALAQMAANTLRKASDHADKMRAAIERSERGLAVTP